jgi:hypothetical protein
MDTGGIKMGLLVSFKRKGHSIDVTVITDSLAFCVEAVMMLCREYRIPFLRTFA